MANSPDMGPSENARLKLVKCREELALLLSKMATAKKRMYQAIDRNRKLEKRAAYLERRESLLDVAFRAALRLERKRGSAQPPPDNHPIDLSPDAPTTTTPEEPPCLTAT